MVLKNGTRDPNTLMRIGMLCLLVALVWPRFLPVTGGLGGDAIDGMRGVLLGLAIGFNLWAVRLRGRLRRGGER
jgi:hypothetical protein